MSIFGAIDAYKRGEIDDRDLWEYEADRRHEYEGEDDEDDDDGCKGISSAD